MPARSCCGVSPVRTSVRISTSGSPSASSSTRMPASGASRFVLMSLDSAFSGETYTTDVWSVRPFSTPSRIRTSIAARNAASVLPDPVGAATSTFRPAWMCGQASACGSVAASKCLPNQAVTAGWKRVACCIGGAFGKQILADNDIVSQMEPAPACDNAAADSATEDAMTYSVRLTKAYRDGFDAQQVDHALAALFRQDAVRVAQLVASGATIKRGVDAATAERYRTAMEAAGAGCAIDDEATHLAIDLPEAARGTGAGTAAPEEETTIWEAGPSLAAYVGPIVLGGLLLVVGVGLLVWLLTWIAWKSASYKLTTQRLFLRRGIVSRK